ncbi:hypothetical protein L2E82_07175 [Cichorium intybus]|uniref:Uncharacterized protein n=1 Tax=Cichorium intybus TaxID=13427 RepID=A0ACB9G4Y7_CICIN|nr:hypothetical protein L2E82_07175 [Cichorium intybus]
METKVHVSEVDGRLFQPSRRNADHDAPGSLENNEEERDDYSEEGESEEGEFSENSDGESSFFGSDQDNERSAGYTVVKETLQNLVGHDDFQEKVADDCGMLLEKSNDMPDCNVNVNSNPKHVENMKVYSPIEDPIQEDKQNSPGRGCTSPISGVKNKSPVNLAQMVTEENKNSEGPHFLKEVSDRLKTLHTNQRKFDKR